jgi:hypothetical protein
MGKRGKENTMKVSCVGGAGYARGIACSDK